MLKVLRQAQDDIRLGLLPKINNRSFLIISLNLSKTQGKIP